MCVTFFLNQSVRIVNLCLKDCAAVQKKLKLAWTSA
jgi:hypothetical protein